MNRTQRAFLLTGILLFIVVGGYFGITQFATTAEAQPGDYIEVPTYGYFACEESDSSVRAPATGWEEFEQRTIDCTDTGQTLVDGCTVTLKTPPSRDDTRDNSYLGYNIRTLGEPCGDEADLDAFTGISMDYYDNKMWAQQSIGGLIGELVGHDAERNVRLEKDQYMCVGYVERGSIDFTWEFAEKGRLAISYRPFFIYRYDPFSPTTGERVPNTEDCTNGNNIEESNLLIEDVRGDGELSQELKESEILDMNNIRAREATAQYLANFVSVVPQYDLFDDGSKYCYDKKIYQVEEVETTGGTYKVANVNSNAVIRGVECCNDGDTRQGYTCEDFEEVRVSEATQCGPLNPCPITGYQAVSGGQVATQECVDGQCVTEYIEVECSYDHECEGGYCNVDPNNPRNNECVTRDVKDYCGNGVCEESRNEDAESCPQDCTPPSDDADNTWVWYLAGGTIVLLFGMLMYQQQQKGGKGGPRPRFRLGG